jgi:hypothetical protein
MMKTDAEGLVEHPKRATCAREASVRSCTVHPRGWHHARGLEAPESGRLKGVMGVQRDLRGEIAIPPGPSGPTGGAFSLGESHFYNKVPSKRVACGRAASPARAKGGRGISISPLAPF